MCGLLLAACGLSGGLLEGVGPAPAPAPGPALAEVAGRPLGAAEAAPLARLMLELRRSLDLPADPGALEDPTARLALAIELRALAAEAERALAGGPRPAGLEDARNRLLARILLARVLAPVESEPVSESDLRARQAEAVDEFRRTGQSGLFEPTRVDAVVVGIGPWPDHADQPDRPPLLDEQGVGALGDRLRAEVGERAPDLDAFLSAATRLAADQPTLRVELMWGIPLEPALSPLQPPLAAALAALDGGGAVSRPVVHGPARYMLRRGASQPGRGERLEDSQAELARAIRLERRRAATERLLGELRRRHEVRVWPERLSPGS
jgi:hypothetical protein